MKIRILIITILLSASGVVGAFAQEDKFIKGFSGGMMVHSGYQYGGDNPFGLDISSPTFGIGGVAFADIDDTVKRKILGENAKRLLENIRPVK